MYLCIHIHTYVVHIFFQMQRFLLKLIFIIMKTIKWPVQYQSAVHAPWRWISQSLWAPCCRPLRRYTTWLRPSHPATGVKSKPLQSTLGQGVMVRRQSYWMFFNDRCSTWRSYFSVLSPRAVCRNPFGLSLRSSTGVFTSHNERLQWMYLHTVLIPVQPRAHHSAVYPGHRPPLWPLRVSGCSVLPVRLHLWDLSSRCRVLGLSNGNFSNALSLIQTNRK